MPIIRKKKKNTYTYECGRMEVCVFGGKVTIYFAEGQIDFSWIAGFQL